MPFNIEFICDSLPNITQRDQKRVPFGPLLYKLLIGQNGRSPRRGDAEEKFEDDLSIHLPSVVGFVERLLREGVKHIPGTQGHLNYNSHLPDIYACMEISADHGQDSFEKVVEFMKVAALYHDVGKHIRRQNHPQIGVNLLRSYDDNEREALVRALAWGPHDPPESAHNRFSLLTSIVQHHDKFGVVSTGEACLPLFSDILYHRSDKTSLAGIKKNITAVMLLNLADAAAVCVAPREVKARANAAVRAVFEDRGNGDALAELQGIWCNAHTCLGLSDSKVAAMLGDWKTLKEAIEHPSVQGNRSRLKRYLIESEQDPDRTIERILRLIRECCAATRSQALLKQVSPTTIEAVLVGGLGSHQFQRFSATLACLVKMDYSLDFFRAIVCATVRKALDKDFSLRTEEANDRKPKRPWARLEPGEIEMLNSLDERSLQGIMTKITDLFVKVIHGIILRYASVLEASTSNPCRFGLQMRELIMDDSIRDTILDFLCVAANREHVALTWLADEVTIWSMD